LYDFFVAANKLRNDILQEFMKFCNTYSIGSSKLKPKDSHRLVLALINKDTENFNIIKWEKNHWADYEDRLGTMLEQISQKAPNLKSLRVKSTFLFDLILTKPCLEFTSKMTSVQTLVITAEWVFSDDDLEMFVETFPNVHSLSVSYK